MSSTVLENTSEKIENECIVCNLEMTKIQPCHLQCRNCRNVRPLNERRRNPSDIIRTPTITHFCFACGIELWEGPHSAFAWSPDRNHRNLRIPGNQDLRQHNFSFCT